MLRIYDDAYLTRRTRLKRLQVLVLFAGGALCGGWLSTANPEMGLFPAAAAAKPLAASQAQTPAWCSESTATSLRLDCDLKLPALHRAEDV